jgi:hypothetical protein
MATFGRILRSLGSGDEQAETVWILGDGSFGIEAVGESNYQEALEQVAGGREAHGVNRQVTAELQLEDDNPFDPQAVMVRVDGLKVGYLSRDHARRFRKEAAPELGGARRILCRGRIRGGWDRGRGDRGHFGVALDIRARQ